MQSTLYSTQTTRQSQDISNSNNNLDTCLAIAWLDLVASNVDPIEGDDWLPLCGDIDEGEIYREWFVWYDADVSKEWEAYDFLTDYRIVATNRASLIAQIDEIEDSRQQVVGEPICELSESLV